MKKKLHIYLAVASAVFVAAEALMHLWQPLLPPGVFAGIATVVGIGSKVAQVLMAAEKLNEEETEVEDVDTTQ